LACSFYTSETAGESAEEKEKGNDIDAIIDLSNGRPLAVK
jgi:hypothetical protein